MRELKIEWQRLVGDEGETCPRCGSTEKELEKAFLSLKKSLSRFGVDVVLEKKELSFGEFSKDPLRSNAIFIAEKPIEYWLKATTGSSRCCDVCGDSECRTVEFDDRIYETVESSLIVKAGMIAAENSIGVNKA